jgi:hypothetical protein
MRWPWQKNLHTKIDPNVDRRKQEADQAVEESKKALEEVQSQWSLVHEREKSQREIREQNHLADLIRESLQRRRTT